MVREGTLAIYQFVLCVWTWLGLEPRVSASVSKFPQNVKNDSPGKGGGWGVLILKLIMII